MQIMRTREAIDLMNMVEGYRSLSKTLEEQLSTRTSQLMEAEATIERQDTKIQNLHAIINVLEAELL